MMLGSVLLQPQALERMQGRSQAADFGDDALALVHSFLLDPVRAEALLPALGKAAERSAVRVYQRIEPRLAQGLAEFRGLFDPMIQAVTRLAQGADAGSAAALLLAIADWAEGFAGLGDSLSDDAVRGFVRRLARILGDTLGLDQSLLRTEFAHFLADARAELLAGTAALSPQAAATRIAAACLLDRIEQELLPLLPAFDLDSDRLADALLAALRTRGLATARAKADCWLEKIGAVLGAIGAVARLAAAAPLPKTPPSRSAAPSRRAGRRSPGDPPRSEDGSYCWYASWLYATRRQGLSGNTPGAAFAQTFVPGYPEDEVWLSADGKRLILRRAGAPDEVLHSAATPFSWEQAPQFAGPASAEYFTFPSGRFSPGFLETWSRVTAVLADLAQGTWHIVNMGLSPKEYAVNIPMLIWYWTRMGFDAAAGAPLASYLAQKADWGVGAKYLYSPLIPWLMVIGGSFEGVHTKTTAKLGFLQWLTLIGGDAINAFSINALVQAVRNVSLSICTMINYDGPGSQPDPDVRPKNWDMAGPWIGTVSSLLSVLVFLKYVIPRHHYGLPMSGQKAPFLLWWLVGGPVIGALGALTGTLLSWCFSRTVTPSQLGKEVGTGALTGLITFILQEYSAKEGDTDGGKWNPSVNPDGDPYTGTDARQPFGGYPPKESSPYRLPYAKDIAMYVGQANQGIFSHMRYNWLPQIYAYDFAHDFGDEVLCVRDGTVVDFYDWLPDNINPDGTQQDSAFNQSVTTMGSASWRDDKPSWNFIVVRHDTRVDAHDQDQGPAATTTYAEYGHGKTGGIRQIFQEKYGKGPTQIVGTRVKQGNPIMLAGCVGVSFHNHLHLHVRGGPAKPASAADAAKRVSQGALTSYTLPFVFADAPGDGVLQHLTWYKSENTRTEALP